MQYSRALLRSLVTTLCVWITTNQAAIVPRTVTASTRCRVRAIWPYVKFVLTRYDTQDHKWDRTVVTLHASPSGKHRLKQATDI